MRLKHLVQKHRFSAVVYGASFFLSIFSAIRGFLIHREAAQPLILHWSEYAGITRIGNSTDLLLLGLFGCILTGVNFIVGLTIEERDLFWGRVVAGATFFVSVLIFVAISAIINVN